MGETKMKREEDVDVENLRDFYKGAYAALTAVLVAVQELECDGAHSLELSIVDMRDEILNMLLDAEAKAWKRLLGGGVRD